MDDRSSRLPDATRIGPVHLRVHNLDESLKFWNLLGMGESRRANSTSVLSARPGTSPLLALTETPDAPQRPRSAPGLFHVAVLYSGRKELARILRRLSIHGYPFQGFADHGVSEALYLADPDGNGVELYADRPSNEWSRNNGEITMVTETLDVDGLLAEIENETDERNAIRSNMQIGHVHLQVSNLDWAGRFYHEILGFDITQRSYPGALFLSAGGYHHHIGLNIWHSRGKPPSPASAAGLLRFSIVLPDTAGIDALKQRLETAGHPFIETTGPTVTARDPDGIEIILSTRHQLLL